MTQATKCFKNTMLATAIALACSPAAFAEEQDSTVKKENALMEVISVTATRRVSRTTDVPYNVSATSSAQLEQLGITDFTKLARNTPGLTFVESGARSSGINSGLIIRGVNTRSSLSTDLKSAQDPTVSTYIGDTALFANFVIKDIDRVEILRGPQGTLYGSGSLGGTIRYMPNKPELDMFEGEVATKISNTNEASGVNTDTYGVFNIPFGDDFALRAVGGYSNNQGFIDANTVFQFNDNGTVQDDGMGNPVTKSIKDSNGDDTSHLRLSLLWQTSDDSSVILTHQRQKDNADGIQAEGGYEHGGGDYAHANRILEPLEREIELTSLDIEVDLGFAMLSSNTSVTDNAATMTSDQSGVYQNSDYYYTLGYYLGPKDLSLGDDYKQDESSFSQEIRLASQSDGPLSWVAGVFYRKMDQENRQYDRLIGYGEGLESFYPSLAGFYQDFWNSALADVPDAQAQKNDTGFYQNQQVDFTDMAVFGELTYQFSDRFQATVGARFFKQEYQAQSDIYLVGCSVSSEVFLGDPDNPSFGCGDDPADLTGKTGGDLSLDVDDFITKVNFSYKLTDDSTVYFTRSEGFRHGGTNGIPLQGSSTSPFAEDPALANYEQDEAVNYELGFKGLAYDGDVKFATALFLIDWDNIQIDGAGPLSGFPIVYNGNSASSQGVELESTISITEDLTLMLGYTYTKAQLDEDFSVGGVNGYKGDSLPNVPEHSASWAFNHYTEIEGMEAYIITNINGNYVSSANSDLNASSPDYSEYDGYSITNASIGISGESWDVTLFVDNLFNKKALTNGRGLRYTNTMNPQSGRDLYSFVNRPRTIGVNVKYQF